MSRPRIISRSRHSADRPEPAGSSRRLRPRRAVAPADSEQNAQIFVDERKRPLTFFFDWTARNVANLTEAVLKYGGLVSPTLNRSVDIIINHFHRNETRLKGFM